MVRQYAVSAPAEWKEDIERCFSTLTGGNAQLLSVFPCAADGMTYSDELEAQLSVLRASGATILSVVDARCLETVCPSDVDSYYDARLLTTQAELLAALHAVVVEASPWFNSTRGGHACGMHFLSVIEDGLCSDGGLYLPTTLPAIHPAAVAALIKNKAVSYADVAEVVLASYLQSAHHLHVPEPRVTSPMLKNFIRKAYHEKRWSAPDVCPVTPLGGSEGPDYLLELFHGPSAAFKDFALQIFPLFFRKSIEEKSANYLILTATSGDTGIAVIKGFAEVDGVKVMVMYPDTGVSSVQKAQMATANDGKHVLCVGVNADFDFCQHTAKTIFNDRSYSVPHTKLSSANSINWGRLLPQVVYYFWAYVRLVQQQGGGITKPINVCVPTGNFGNILAAVISKRMGLPFHDIILAANENNVLHEFVQTGVYDIRDRPLSATHSPSIDILRASNVERFLYFLTDGNTKQVAAWMKQLDVEKRFEVGPEILKHMRDVIRMRSAWCTTADAMPTIRETYKTTGVLLDTHTAVAAKCLTQLRQSKAVEADAHTIIASTAHWAKFPHAVMCALQEKTVVSAADAALDVSDVYAAIAALAPKASSVPRALQLPPSENRVVKCEADIGRLQEVLSNFAAV